MKVVYKILRFFNLVDKGNNLSITNIALVVVLTKIVIAPSFSIEECGVLMLALLNYAHKRHEAAKTDRSMFQSIDELKADVESYKSAYLSQIDSLKKELAEVKAISEDAKDKAIKLSTVTSLKNLNGRS
jgi:hypothetical protein